jgi:hypothetical protein
MYLALPSMEAAQCPEPEVAGSSQPWYSLQRKLEFTRDYADLGVKTHGREDVCGAISYASAMNVTRVRR